MKTACRDCEFSLDFSKGVLEAHSLFEVSTVGDGRPGAPETLEIAQIKGSVCVDTENQVRVLFVVWRAVITCGRDRFQWCDHAFVTESS